MSPKVAPCDHDYSECSQNGVHARFCDMTELADPAAVEQFDCPMCEVSAGSTCRTRGGKVAPRYHTPRLMPVPQSRTELEVRTPAERGPGRLWQAGPEVDAMAPTVAARPTRGAVPGAVRRSRSWTASSTLRKRRAASRSSPRRSARASRYDRSSPRRWTTPAPAGDLHRARDEASCRGAAELLAIADTSVTCTRTAGRWHRRWRSTPAPDQVWLLRGAGPGGGAGVRAGRARVAGRAARRGRPPRPAPPRSRPR